MLNELTDLTELVDDFRETENLLEENRSSLYSYQCNFQENRFLPNTPAIEVISIASISIT